MRAILRKPGLRFVFVANVISMLGSGMNSAAVAWYILQATHSAMALGTFAVVQTIPAMLLLPFTGVIIDREDRRRLVMWLDAVRAIIIVAVAILAFLGKVKIWELYLMNMLVAAGFWMFWPTITALIQELTPDEEFIHANTFLLAGVQGGWLMAGAIVGFVYNHIGLGGVLLIDFLTTWSLSSATSPCVKDTMLCLVRQNCAQKLLRLKLHWDASGARCGKASSFCGNGQAWCCWEAVGLCFLAQC